MWRFERLCVLSLVSSPKFSTAPWNEEFCQHPAHPKLELNLFFLWLALLPLMVPPSFLSTGLQTCLSLPSHPNLVTWEFYILTAIPFVPLP